MLLAYSGKVDFDLKFAVQQIQAKQKAKNKIPSWYADPDLLFPVNLSMEQASSGLTAKYKAGHFKGSKMIDLTGGLGVDAYFLGKNYEQATYCERDKNLFEISKHNLSHLSPGKFDFYNGDSLDFLRNTSEKFDLIFVDPARRGGHNQKLYRLEDCEPDIIQNWELLRSKGVDVLVKASPMLDIKAALKSLNAIHKVIVLSVKNEVKEVLLFSESGAKEVETQIEAVDLKSNCNNEFSFTYSEEEKSFSQIAEKMGKYLIEPFSAILKAGAFNTFAVRYGFQKVHPNSHLYTADVLVEDCPGRFFEIISEIQQPKKEIKSLFPEGKVNVITRNYSLSADALKKKHKLKDGGDDFLLGAKTTNGFSLWYCNKIR
ncbi:MAG: class I SAM-dependent methyltransferase [Mongoliibacter sp.]|nr:class I SAM-dependent methyltransferase [Mongoliibacter sp.]TVP42850.1 MAG: class I SAM-dependent methyltransferase [Mongoliibacter sp.]